MNMGPVTFRLLLPDRLMLTTLGRRTRLLDSMGRVHAAKLFVLLWALLAMPALCTAGLLSHQCDCGNATGCTHESDCGSDPCRIVALRHDDGSAKGTDLVPALVSLVLLTPASPIAFAVEEALAIGAYEPPLRAHLPYPALTTVLLI
jgi:hypothetical protein